MQMQLASIPVLCEPPLAAMPQLSEKPHLGFATKKTTWKPAPNVCNFTVTLGLQVVVVENGVRKTYSARYYNPATGRFLSRDPEDGNITDPATLHKYLYANGDPVNMVDPRGRGAYEDGLLIGKIIGRAVVQVAFVGCLVDTMYAGIAEVLKAVAEHHPGVPKLPMPPLPFHLPCVVLGVYWGILWASGLFFGTAG
jgi:RHS repeat-associated protein